MTGAGGPGRRGAVVVLGASGGCGTSLLAGGLALAWQREGGGAWLIELDLGRGDLADAWDLPGDRSVADLARVADELAPHHLRAASQAHASGLAVLVSAAAPGGPAWDRVTAGRLLDAALAAAGPRGRCAVDGGCGLRAPAAGAAARAGGVLIVCAPRVASARRARRVLAALEEGGHGARCALVVAAGPGRPEIGARALGRAVGVPVAAELPWSEREGADLSAGRWPAGRRRRLASAIAVLAGTL